MVANVVIVRDSPQCFRIVFHARLFTFLVDHRYRATSIIPSHHEIIRPVVHRGSDRSILFADLPVSRIRVAQSVSSSFGFPDNTRNTPVHFSASLSRTEGETRRGRFLYRNRNAWIVLREWTTSWITNQILSRLDKNMYSKRKTMVADFRSNNGNNVDATRSYAGG